MEGAERYCIECGNALEPTDRFCPACGAMAKDLEDFGPEFEDGAVVSSCAVYEEGRSRTLNSVMILTVIWGAFAVFMGIYILMTVSETADAFIDMAKDTSYEDGTMWDYFTDNGFDRGTVESLYTGIGALFAVSGAFALLSAYLDYRMTNYRYALLCLIVSTIFGAMGIIPLIAGIIVTVYLTKCKSEFYS